MVLRKGSVIADRYRVVDRVGAGATGEVWAGEHVGVGLKVALKTLSKLTKGSSEAVARFKREAYFLGRIQSDYVARVVDFVDDPSHGLILVMELVEGESLQSVLKTRRATVEQAIEIGVDVVSGLCDLHRAHIIHRDLKPANILLKPLPDGRYRAMIVDFGVSRSIAAKGAGEDGADGLYVEDTITGITRSHVALGTMEYMAPEQVLNAREVTVASDIYALGALLYRAVSGRHIFEEQDPAEFARKKLMTEAPPLKTGRADPVAQAFEAVVARALKRRPVHRFESASAMLAELAPLRELARSSGPFAEATTPGSSVGFEAAALIEDEVTSDASAVGPIARAGAVEIVDEESTTENVPTRVGVAPAPTAHALEAPRAKAIERKESSKSALDSAAGTRGAPLPTEQLPDSAPPARADDPAARDPSPRAGDEPPRGTPPAALVADAGRRPASNARRALVAGVAALALGALFWSLRKAPDAQSSSTATAAPVAIAREILAAPAPHEEEPPATPPSSAPTASATAASSIEPLAPPPPPTPTTLPPQAPTQAPSASVARPLPWPSARPGLPRAPGPLPKPEQDVYE